MTRPTQPAPTRIRSTPNRTLAVLALVVVNALRGSPWGLFTIASTIPIALLMGWWMKIVRPGKVLEASVMGGILLMGGLVGGQ